MRLVAIGVMLLATVACAADPHNLEITEQNKDSYMESLKDSKGLTVEETGLLTMAQVRRSTAKAFGGNEPSIVGKTLEQVQFTDLFGKEIYSTNLTISDPIGAGARDSWTGGIKYNQFIAEHQAFRNADLANMKIV